MKFLTDVNVPQSVISYLTQIDHEVLDIKKQNPLAKDLELIKIAKEEERIILTLDKDFISWAQFPQHRVATIVIRLKDQSPQHILEHLKQLLENQEEGILQTSLTIIKEETADSHPF